MNIVNHFSNHGGRMDKAIRGILSSMDVRGDKEDAENKAYEIYSRGPGTLDLIIDYGLELKGDVQDKKSKNLVRAVIFTLLIFYLKDKSAFVSSDHFSKAVNLLIDFYGNGFLSAQKVLSEFGFSEFDICRRQLLSLPEVEKHRNDKEVSTHEAYEEIRLSKLYSGLKGLMKDHYALGRDNKYVYDIYRIGKKTFALRSHKTI